MIEKLEKVMSVYSLYDKEINIYDCFLTSFDDQEAIKYFMNMFKDIIFTLKDDDASNKFNEKLKNTCVCKVADFDNRTGEFTNIKNVLIDYLDINIIKEYFMKDEVKKDNE